MLIYSPVTRGTTKNEFLKTIVLFLNCSENTGHVEKSLQAYHLTSIINQIFLQILLLLFSQGQF